MVLSKSQPRHHFREYSTHARWSLFCESVWMASDHMSTSEYHTYINLQTPIQSKMVRGRNILSQCSGWFPARHVGMAGTCGNLRICGWTTYQPLLRELYNWELGFKKIVANLCISTMSTDYCTWMGVIIIYLAYFQWASGLDKNLPCPWPWRALVINSPKIVMRSMCWHAVRGREVLIL